MNCEFNVFYSTIYVKLINLFNTEYARTCFIVNNVKYVNLFYFVKREGWALKFIFELRAVSLHYVGFLIGRVVSAQSLLLIRSNSNLQTDRSPNSNIQSEITILLS